MENVVYSIKERFSHKILKLEEKSSRRIYIDFKPEDIPTIVKFVFRDLRCRFATATGIDTPKGIEILYHFSHDPTGKMITLRTLILDKKNPEIESITPLFPGAEWIEREMWELLGIDFVGHPNLKHLLLIDEWPEDNYPLRKSR